mgnify:CR=1 FL=1
MEISGKRTGLNNRLGGEAHPSAPVFTPVLLLLGIPFKPRTNPFKFAALGGRGNSPNGPERPLWGAYAPLLKARGGRAILNERKRQSINALAGAIAEAESKLYNEDSTDLNGLRALLMVS